MELHYHGSGKVYYKEKEYRFDIYINDDYGAITIKIIVKQSFCSFIELPININSLAGEYDNGFKFTLLDCQRAGTNDLVSYNQTIFSYSAKYMIKGIGGIDNSDIKFNTICFNIDNIVEWGGISAYSLDENKHLTYNKNIKSIIFDDSEYKIEYSVLYSLLPVVENQLLKSSIELKQTGVIEISLKNKTEGLLYFENFFIILRRLIEVSIIQSVHLTGITGYSDCVVEDFGDEQIKRPIEIIGRFDKKIDSSSDDIKTWKWINLPELIENNGISNYFSKYELFKPVIELYIEILYAERVSATKVFLNLVQALETYHSRFITNDIKDFRERVNLTILAKCPDSQKTNYKNFLLAHSNKFITLESRIADLLLAEFNKHFDTGDINHQDFPHIIAQTRNYYIHYDENLKTTGKILSVEELILYNHVLFNILEYHFLTELGFKNTKQLTDKLNERWGNVSTALSIKKASEGKHNP